MGDWTDDELDRIGAAEELRISSRRRDGSFSPPIIIWVVRVGVVGERAHPLTLRLVPRDA